MIKVQHIAAIIFMMILIFISFSFIIGYSLPLKELPQQLYLETYNLPNNRVSKEIIDINDPVYQKLKELLYKNRSGWTINIVDVPAGVYNFRGKSDSQSEFVIRCYKDGIIINMRIWGEYIEFTKHIPNTLQTLGLPNLWPEKYRWLSDE